ncbi:MAG: hypothetical protein GX565_01130 [Lentisphaerae bacterium]|nr:hypothetical protein [Lentisphaerota bacterium]
MKHIGNWYINKTNVKARLLAQADRRAKKFGRVSGETYEWLNDVVRWLIDNLVASHPSVGKTIYPPIRDKPTRRIANECALENDGDRERLEIRHGERLPDGRLAPEGSSI